MSELPPGWKADYDGQRWFFTYGPTGQSQFQVPLPGDEFPDFYCCPGAAVPAVELLPEEKLESEKQMRRMLNVSGGSTGAVVDEKERLNGREGLRREESGDGVSDVCFESFAAVKSRGWQDLGGSREGTKTTKQRVGNENAAPARTSMTDACKESIGEPMSTSLVAKGEYDNASSPPYREEGSITTIAIMSEPVLAAVETTPVAPSLGQQGERPPIYAAHSSPHDLTKLDDRAIESAQKALSALSVVGIPELYSESTALCEHEINPPPVELPVNEGGWMARITGSSLAIQSPVELPAYAEPGISPERRNRIAEIESNSFAPLTLAEDHAVTSDAGPMKTIGAKSGGHDRAGLPSQTSRMFSKLSNERTSPRDRVSCTLDEEHSTRGTDQPVEISGTERRDLTHFPSILRPGPRRSRQPSLQQAGPVMPAPATYTSHAAGVQLQRPQEQQQRKKVEAGSMSQEQSARMPAMPPAPRPPEMQPPASTAGPEAPPHGDGPRQKRLPSSVNFVIPIQHISSAETSSAPDRAEATGSPNYRLSASFASVTSSGEHPRAGAQTSGNRPALLPGRKTDSWGQPADEVTFPARLVSGRTAAEVPEWSWGYAG